MDLFPHDEKEKKTWTDPLSVLPFLQPIITSFHFGKGVCVRVGGDGQGGVVLATPSSPLHTLGLRFLIDYKMRGREKTGVILSHI